MFGCFFGHKWWIVLSTKMTVTHSILCGWRTHDEDAFAKLQVCLRCGKVRAILTELDGEVKSIKPEMIFSRKGVSALRRTAIPRDLTGRSFGICDECDKWGWFRLAPPHWPKDTPGVPEDVGYCDEHYASNDKSMAEDGFTRT